MSCLMHCFTFLMQEGCGKNVYFKTVTDNISSNTLSVSTYPSHFKLSASHYNNLQRERERESLWRYFRM